MTRFPAAWNTASNASVKLESRSCRTNFARAPASPRSMRRFRACWRTQDWTGCPRPLAQGYRGLMAQHQDLGVLPPRLPPRQAQREHIRHDDTADQFQAHKPKIIARQPEPDLPARHRSQDRVEWVPQRRLPRWHRFSALTGRERRPWDQFDQWS